MLFYIASFICGSVIGTLGSCLGLPLWQNVVLTLSVWIPFAILNFKKSVKITDLQIKLSEK